MRPQMAPDGPRWPGTRPSGGGSAAVPGAHGVRSRPAGHNNRGPKTRAPCYGARNVEVSEGCMQLLRTGDSGPAVAEVRSALREFGLLTPLAAGAPDDHYDSFVEGAVRAFQQQRGLITDGVVGPATYRALREARWTLGDRMLGLMISAP